ncbi:hypothetical protein E2C01_062034 [Portunus trituberculatus]|uniref:Uncharacterized protein n=1 Tax=Portunus trituberculatus TaxID=210409 RepID=A0A5B7HFZ4_PORTR|nr:hypothetical protein [Portunus trituberculatus]
MLWGLACEGRLATSLIGRWHARPPTPAMGRLTKKCGPQDSRSPATFPLRSVPRVVRVADATSTFLTSHE